MGATTEKVHHFNHLPLTREDILDQFFRFVTLDGLQYSKNKIKH